MKDRLIAKTRVVKEKGRYFIEYQEERTFLEKIFFISQSWNPLWEPVRWETIKMGGQWVDMQLLVSKWSFKTQTEAEEVAKILIGKTQHSYRNPESRVVIGEFGGKDKNETR